MSTRLQQDEQEAQKDWGRSNALYRLQGEIAQSLEQVRREMEIHLGDEREDPRPLLAAADQLSQVAGTVSIIQCVGASILADEMRELMNALIAGRVSQRDRAFDALSTASLQLSDYVELLVAGEPDYAAVLLPALNEMRVARQAPVLDENTLFCRQIGTRVAALPPACGESPERATADAQALAQAELNAYQQSFVHWFKGQGPPAALAAMQRVAERVAAAATAPAVRRLWWALSLLAAAMKRADAPLELRRLLGRSGMELKRLAAEGEAAAASAADAVTCQVLYWLAREAAPGDAAQALLRGVDARRCLPDAPSLARARDRLAHTPNRGVLAQLQEELRRELQNVKDAIDLRVRTHGRAGEDLSPAVAGLERIADTLGVLGLPALARVLRNQAGVLPTLAADAPQWMDVATALIRVDAELAAALASGLQHDGEQTLQPAAAAAAGLRADIAALAKQALAGLSQVEAALDKYVNGGGLQLLAGLGRRVEDISASLRVGEMERLSEQLDVVAAYLDSEFAASVADDSAAAERVAEAMASIDFYLEAVRDGVPQTAPLLDRVATCVAPLLSELEAALAHASADHAAVATAPGIAPAPSAEIAGAVDAPAAAGPAASAPQASPPPRQDAASRTVDPVDPELVDIFVDEAEEVVAGLKRDLRQLKQAPQDDAALAEVRRAFHTLKGSGRMVGASGMGEFAWAVEQLLNRCLDGTLSLQAPIIDVAEQATGLVPRLIEALKRGDAEATTVPEAQRLAAHADALREDSAAGADLYELFRDDALERLALLGNWLAQQSPRQAPTQGPGVEVEPEIERVFHTLRGSAAVCGATPVQRVAAATESWLHKLRQTSRPLDETDFVLLGDLADSLKRWIGPVGLDAAAENESDAVLARIEERQDASAASTATAPSRVNRDAFTLQALEQLQGIEADVRAWRADPRPAYGAGLGDRFRALAAASAAYQYPALAEVTLALAEQVGSVAEAPATALFPALEDVFEQLYQRLDAARDGLPEADPALLLDQIAGLPLASSSARWSQAAANETDRSDETAAESTSLAQDDAPTVLDDPEAQAVFNEEAEELLSQCRAALQALAADGEDASALASLRRTLHTLKGSARMVGRTDIGDLAARAERRVPADAAGGTALPLAAWQADCEQLQARLPDGGAQADSTVSDEHGVYEVPGVVEADASQAAAQLPAPAEPEAELELETGPGPGPEADTADGFMAAAVAVGVPEGLDVELLGVFAAEAGDLLQGLDTALARWTAPDSPDQARRVLHTLKGSARAAGLNAMADVAHGLEDDLETVVTRDVDEPLQHSAAMQRGVDSLHTQYAALRRGNYSALLADAAPAAAVTSPWQADLLWQPPDERTDAAAVRREHARVSVEALDRMLGQTSELSTQRERLVEQNTGLNAQLAEFERTVDRLRSQLHMLVAETDAQIAARGLDTGASATPDRYGESFDPLEMDRYSRMQELSRTLSEAVNDLGVLHETMERAAVETDAVLTQQAQTAATVQQGLMDTLLVPFSSQQAWLERVVRQTAEGTGKRARLTVLNGEIELDRNVLERIAGPLEHLVRNAVVHGIESPAARTAAGKRAEGRVDLRLRREVGQVVVEVSDDGRGLDLNAIRAKALRGGLLADDAEADQAELARLIFQPGFSTAPSLTQYAGRGVGLDVVNSGVRQLGGTLDLRARPGEPLAFVLRLPVSLALSQMLLVRVGGQRYTLPLAGIAGIARIASDELDARLQADGVPVNYGGEDYPVHYLGDFLEQPRPGQVEERSLVAVLAQAGETLGGDTRRVALVIDELLGVQEIMAKVAGPQLGDVGGVAGAATLPDGGVAITLDLVALVSRQPAAAAAVEAEASASAPAAATVMVVDDSITMRRIAARLLENNGYRVVTARDGLDAMDQLQDETPAVVLLDIEMPRADGFEVATFIRNDARLAKTPIIMITSRSGEKHREHARQIGVERYLVKPYQEAQLLQEIRALQGRSPSSADE